jgi:acrylyl-CoA reductase (NADPH)
MTPRFRAFRVVDESGTISGAVRQMSLEELTPGEVVIETAFSSVNYKDALASTGSGKVVRKYPIVTGIDVAGTIVSAPPGGSPALRAGDAALVTGYDLGVANDGGYAQYVRVPAAWVVPVPAGLSLFDAMAIGTAGFTAALSITRLERVGLTAGSGPVIVTGATGGVGSLAVACLARLGYHVTALTGKEREHAYLKSLGATDVISRNSLDMGSRPLEKATWAGAIDPVGGPVLGWLTRTMKYGGSIANSGLTAGTDLHTTVLPFILRSVNLLGIDSAMCGMGERLDVWRRLASDMKPAGLDQLARVIRLEELPEAFSTLLAGGARGRFVVRPD